MKTIILTTMLALTVLAGCIDENNDDDAPEDPVAPSAQPSFNNTQPDSVTGLEHMAQLELDGQPWSSGSGIWVRGDHVYGSSLGRGFFIADISDPEHPVMVWNATTDAADEDNNTITSFSRDADLVEHPDGRLTLVLATQGDGMHIWDVTQSAAPRFLARVEVDPNHNIAVVPGTQLVFNSQSGGTGSGRSNDLVDLSDPANPVVLGVYGTHGCHDITFFGSFGDDTFRGFCAGIQRTEIWDLSGLDANATDFGIALIGTVGCPAVDPTGAGPALAQETVDCTTQSPVVGNPLLSAYPLRTLHHLAMVNHDGTILIVGDEQNGGGSPGGCYAYDETTGRSTPFGALWFYDISDPASATLLNWLSAPSVESQPDPQPDPAYDPAQDVPNCTAHFGTLVPGEEKMAMAWYSAGVLLIDFEGVSPDSAPTILDQFQPAGTNPWDARIHNGYVFTGDIGRGMDVLKLV